MSIGIMQDLEVIAGLEWLASTQRDKQNFYRRLAKVQQHYIIETSKPENFGKRFEAEWYGPDVVADRRRAKIQDAIRQFKPASKLVRLNVHFCSHA